MTREEFILCFVQSVERERDVLGLTQAQMASKLNMSLSGYKKMIAGETAKIDLYIAYLIYEITGKLLFDFGESSSEQLQLFDNMMQLSPMQIRFVKGIVDFELAFQDTVDPENANDYINLMTPTGDMEDGMIWDSVNIEKFNASSYRKRYGSALHCALLINSHHFHPVYNKGDILLVSMCSPRDGDTGVFINKEEGRAYLRRFRQSSPCRLEPINGYGVPFTLDPNDEKDMAKWIILGKILSRTREKHRTHTSNANDI